jgi:lipopolysaccharide export system protein LptA
MKKIFIYSFAAIIVIDLLAFQSNQTENGNEIILKSADSLHGSNVVNQSYRELFGNVILLHKDIKAKSDFAKQNLDANTAEMRGNVIITQNTMTMKSPKIFYDAKNSMSYADDSVSIEDKRTYLRADQGIYSTKNMVADFTGHVYINDDSATIYAEHIIYERKTRNSFAYNKVKIFGKFTNVILTGDTVYNVPEEKFSYAGGNPVLYQIDTVTYDKISPVDSTKFSEIRFDTLTVSADSMLAYRLEGNEHYIFKGNVEIIRGLVSAKCSQAIYYKDKEYIVLQNKPIVWYDSTQLYGDSILISLPKKELREIKAFKDAIAITKTDSIDQDRLNQISGREIFIKIDNSKISGLKAIGDAKSLYFFGDEKGSNGVDKKSTDSIQVVFLNGEVENIIWLGMSVSEFFPENLVFTNPKEYNLPLFKWNEQKPKKKILKPGFLRKY